MTVLDIRKRLEEISEWDSPVLDPKWARALYAVTLGLAAYVGLEPEEFVGLIETAAVAPTINEGGEDILTALRDNLGVPL